MITAGTLFRWRNDPNATVYRVITRLGERQTENFQHKTYGNHPSKRRRQIVVKFVDQLTGGPMDPSVWGPFKRV